MTYKLETFNFEEEEVHVVVDKRNGKKYIPVKRLSEKLGISYKGQLVKVTDDPKFNYLKIGVVAADGKEREMICIPEDKSQTFLMSINSRKIGLGKPENEREAMREKLLHYQGRMSDWLYNLETKGYAINTDKVQSVDNNSSDLMVQLKQMHQMMGLQIELQEKRDAEIQENREKIESAEERIASLEENKLLEEVNFLKLPIEVEVMCDTDPVKARKELNALMQFTGEYCKGYVHGTNWHGLIRDIGKYGFEGETKATYLYKNDNESSMEQIVRRKLISKVYKHAWQFFEIERYLSDI